MARAGWAQSTVDYARDIQPLFRQNCYGCHGPAQQMAGLRLDRRSSAFKTGARRVVPGSVENSLLVHRIRAASEFGPQMPPTGPLKPEQIELIGRWIAQGAIWPDSLANETDRPPSDPKATAAMEQLRSGDRAGFLKTVNADPKLLNARGPAGVTPFMHAVLYGDAALLEQLLKLGANVNARDDANATALMWAASNLAKARVLVAHNADVNTMSDDGNTALTVAAGFAGRSEVVKLLLDHGANLNPTRIPAAQPTPLTQAAVAGDAETLQLLLARGAVLKEDAGNALDMAVAMGCQRCVDLLLARKPDKEAVLAAMPDAAVLGNMAVLRYAVAQGVDLNKGERTALMNAAVSDLMPVEAVRFLIGHGADVNARSAHKLSGDTGLSVLDIARMNGETPVVQALVQAGATSARAPETAPKPAGAQSIADAVARSLPLLQKADAGFTTKSGCVSCHNDSMAAMAYGAARQRGIHVDEALAAEQVKANLKYLAAQREGLRQGLVPGAGPTSNLFMPGVMAYILIGLNAEHYPADVDTDAVALYLLARQTPDGNWPYPKADARPPICSDYIGQTASILRALQTYAPKTERAAADTAIRAAANWLAHAAPTDNEDRFWRLQGLAWYGKDKAALETAVKDVLAAQKADGGWSALPTTDSNAYATGRALVALRTAGATASDAAYERGVRYLLANQLADGSWRVATRALGFQPFFETGFPHGFNQAISAAGTAWAAMALAMTPSTPAKGKP